MPPKTPSGKKPYVHEINPTPEWEQFIDKLRKFYKERESPFDAEPRLQTQYGHINVDLLVLYNAVIAQGGYDEIANIPKGWQNLAKELGMHFDDNKPMGQLGYQLKSVFYKNLCAYWIHDQYGKEPPPKEILESQTCASRNGPVLTRTLENYTAPVTKKAGEEAAPKESAKSKASTPVSGNRASGRLREAPPQRIPFQPETGPSRNPNRANNGNSAATSSGSSMAMNRGSTPLASHQNTMPNQQANRHSHTPYGQNVGPQRHEQGSSQPNVQSQQPSARGASTHYQPPSCETASRLTEYFEPRPQPRVPLIPVNTPGSNPVEFARRQRLEQGAATGMSASQAPRPVVPGIGHEGAIIYARCLQSLRCPIPAEQAFALNHLVKISYERGDKFKFDQFHGLAEGLVDRALEVGALFYHVEWEVVYIPTDEPSLAHLDGENGTKDILERIEKLERRNMLDYMQSAEFTDKFARVNEAALTLRNMMILPDNATYASEVYPLKDLLCILLHLPNLEIVTEVKHYALDIAEQLTPYLNLTSDDPLYRTLLSQLSSTDRGTILTALRAVSRISLNLEATNMLEDIPPTFLQNIMDWLLLNDEELVDACLDFLYQYTAVVANVESLLKAVDMGAAVTQLVRLLRHGAKQVKEVIVLEPESQDLPPEQIPGLPRDLREKLLVTDEPQRCFQWLQSLFEEDSQSHITQIAIWQAYQSSFASSNRNTLSAADFIRNVSSVFMNARAQIIRSGDSQRFIIEGIRARITPLNPATGEEYAQCLWIEEGHDGEQTCDEFHLGPEKMWLHLLEAHAGHAQPADGMFREKAIFAYCRWQGCRKYPTPTPDTELSHLSRHFRVHLAGSRTDGAHEGPAAKRQRKSYTVPAKTMTFAWEQTLTTTDEQTKVEQPAGIPLSAVLVLRNIARNVAKTESEELLFKEAESGGEPGGWAERLFRPVMGRLFDVFTHNKAMAEYIVSLLELLDQR